jgi:hypothetical protein
MSQLFHPGHLSSVDYFYETYATLTISQQKASAVLSEARLAWQVKAVVLECPLL